mgnify:CR=1 FL=1
MKNIDLNFLIGKDISFVLKKANELTAESLEGKIHAHKIYSVLLDQIPNNYESSNEYILRGVLRQKIWDCERFFFWNEKYLSQAGQDKIIKDHFFKGKKDGFFVEIGAYDGLRGSNCFHFEKFLNWKGIAIEASPIQFEALKKNRKCEVINEAISSSVKDVEFVEVTEGLTQMSGINNDVFKKNNESLISKDTRSKTKNTVIRTTTFDKIIPEGTKIDYLSIDIEGEELDLLKSINFNNYEINVISVENNIPKDQNFKFFFDNKNFEYFDRIGQDEIFFNRKF